MKLFGIAFWGTIVAQMVIRAPLNKKRRLEKMSERQVTGKEKSILGLLFLGGFLLPLLYSTTSWLDFANYTLPVWAGWIGVVLIAAALYVFWRAHADLGLNWSPTLEIREKHELITRGIYGVIRHPMYAALLLVGISWASDHPSFSRWMLYVLLLLVLVTKMKLEERILSNRFAAYQEYQRSSWKLVPFIW